MDDDLDDDRHVRAAEQRARARVAAAKVDPSTHRLPPSSSRQSRTPHSTPPSSLPSLPPCPSLPPHPHSRQAAGATGSDTPYRGQGKVPANSTTPLGFVFADARAAQQHADFMQAYFAVLARRSARWNKRFVPLAKFKPHAVLPQPAAKRFVRKGVPANLRADVWMVCSGADAQLAQNPGHYQRLLGQEQAAASAVAQIELDLHRTFPNNTHFSAQRSTNPDRVAQLKRILTAHAVAAPDTGYVQGMGSIAGFLLLVIRSEEKAFWLFHTLLTNILPRMLGRGRGRNGQANSSEVPPSSSPSPALHSHLSGQESGGSRGGAQCSRHHDPVCRPRHHTDASSSCDLLTPPPAPPTLRSFLRERLPAVWSFLQRSGAPLHLTTMRWFIKLYIDTLPEETVLRVFDALFLEGDKILYRVAVAIFEHCQAALLRQPCDAGCLEYINTLGTDIFDCHAFLERVFAIPHFPRSAITERRRAHQQVQ